MSGKFSKRTSKELSPVLYEPSQDERRVYEVKREIAKIENIRYDETTIFPGLLGRELPKTFGHYHPKNPAGVYYPEIYGVLKGRAWHLIQRPAEKNPRKIEEVYLIEAKEKEKIVIPPGFGHISINPENKKLEMANWIGSNFSYDYETYENLRGGCYYLLESRDSQAVEFEKNSYYENVPEIVKLKPKEIPQLGIFWKTSLYDLIKTPQNLEFLIKPEKYLELLTIENCFKKI